MAFLPHMLRSFWEHCCCCCDGDSGSLVALATAADSDSIGLDEIIAEQASSPAGACLAVVGSKISLLISLMSSEQQAARVSVDIFEGASSLLLSLFMESSLSSIDCPLPF